MTAVETGWRTTPARRRRILDAALACFLEQGVAATTVEDIRARSGASVGSLYHHFAGKHAIADALYTEALADFQDGLLRVLRIAPDARAGVEGGVRHHLRWLERRRDLARFLLRRQEAELSPAGHARLAELNRQFLGAVRGWLDEQVAAGAIRPLPFDLFYASTLGPAQEFGRHWLAGRTRTGLRAAERELAHGAWRAVRADG